MPLLSESIPNLPLTGSEVMEYAIALVREYAPRYAGVPFKAQLHFTMQNPAIPAYDVVASVSQAADVKCPECDGKLPADQLILCETCCGELKVPNTPKLALSNLLAEIRKRMTTDWVFGTNLAYPKIQYAIVLSLLVGPERELSQRELSGEVSNPNLVRVHYDLPIRQAEKVLPTPEQPMGGLRWGLLTFSKGDYPEPVAPVEKNLTPAAAPAADPITCRLCSEPVIAEGLCESHLQEADDKLDEEENAEGLVEDDNLSDEEVEVVGRAVDEMNSSVAAVAADEPGDKSVVTPKQRSKRKDKV